jgi:hypothetical protein
MGLLGLLWVVWRVFVAHRTHATQHEDWLVYVRESSAGSQWLDYQC